MVIVQPMSQVLIKCNKWFQFNSELNFVVLYLNVVGGRDLSSLKYYANLQFAFVESKFAAQR